MADVQDPTTAPEPSMEEILASIRKIIADENTPAEPKADEIDVVELTQMVQEDGTVVDLTEEPPPPEPFPASHATNNPAPTPTTPHAIPAGLAEAKALISDNVATEAASSLSSLVNTIAIDRFSSAPPASYTHIGNGTRTLEDMVIELMRPLLKDWLDRNLPATVERLVQKEIEHIARRAKD